MDLLVASALEAESSLPSFFEMFMTHQVEQSIKPAARHAHGALAARWHRLHIISPWFEEVYLTLVLLVEARCLAKSSCLLFESFYGLRRCRYGPVHGPPGPRRGAAADEHLAFEYNGAGYGPGQRLRTRDRRKALLVAAVIPYLVAKLDAAHERQAAINTRQNPPSAVGMNQRSGTVADSSMRDRPWRSRMLAAARRARARMKRRLASIRSLFFQVYPLLRGSYEGSFLLYQWLYLFRRSAFFSPALRLTGMVVRRATVEDAQEDIEEAESAKRGAAVVQSADCTEDAAMAVDDRPSVRDRVFQYGRIALVLAVVGFKIAEWWTRVEAQEGPSWRRNQMPPPPPPPPPPLPGPGGCGVPADAGACPACGSARVNPALCAVSGFVFCFMCLSRHVREHEECPVTGLPCRRQDIVRLFDEDGVGSRGA